METPSETGRKLLRKAKEDERIVALILPSKDPVEEPLGFHCQQAVEKALKSILAAHRVPYRKTHDIAELLDGLTDAGFTTPQTLLECDTLTVFAVSFRYDTLEDFDRSQVDRVRFAGWCRSAIAWAESELARLTPPPPPGSPA